MKRNVLLVLILFLITIGFAFAEGTYEVSNYGPGTKAVERDLASKKFDELARGINDSYLYILAKDANWTLYIYKAHIGMDGTYDGSIYLFQETGKVTKDSIAKKINSGKNLTKCIDGNYIVYEIGTWSDDYYCKTPKGDFYAVTKLIKKADNAASFTGIDDFLN